ncbi:MAG: 2-hydroxyhepta-2,4-diene-1,7-dioate isomerase [Ignavibacteria bacterium GWB2_36_8]|nr:MAG: 2-hydroxyhepta-2,4-diene-1,7-dioate isomerase [Ignavibacteria bacterium GWB2_36_8]OGU53825.1 MAG: 2-hydroxyhepta-2,4-diene-1,7-dioate isomerase [Ignavibacteria bacterium GWC2_36_12]
MRLYKTKNCVVIEADEKFYLLKDEDWDSFVNDDNLFDKMLKNIQSGKLLDRGKDILNNIEAPIHSQEIWASGVTYMRSKIGRQEESKNAGGGDFYGKVYEAERPELFFKATHHRVANPGGKVRIRKDSTWNVPEPELTLMITSSGKIVGYTIGNDMSSRSIEGENPLYLPQAKTYDGCAAVGPCIYVTKEPLSPDTVIDLEIKRSGETVFQGDVELNQLKRKPEELVSFLYRECSFPNGSLLMTGTGIVPSSDFSLQSGDEIIITIGLIGTLINTVK